MFGDMFKRSFALGVGKAEVMQRLHYQLRRYHPVGRVGADDFVLYKRVVGLGMNRLQEFMKLSGKVCETEEGCRVTFRVALPKYCLFYITLLGAAFVYGLVKAFAGGSWLIVLLLAGTIGFYILIVMWQVRECAERFEQKIKSD